ncbi:MAG: hypothetical protein NG740_00905, partial [Omnitrophica bacterium]|nr:hypothetical protein [Candidatus Omnitrophota bacterium]
PSSIDYTLTFTPPEGFEGTTLEVTTIVTSINDYDGVSGLHYDAGQVLVEETQEIALGTDNTLDYSYAPSVDLIGGMVIGSVSLFAELSIIITDPESGLSYTIVYDDQLFIYRLGSSLPTEW